MTRHIMQLIVDPRLVQDDDALRAEAATWMNRVAVAASSTDREMTVAQVLRDAGVEAPDASVDIPVRGADVRFTMLLRPPVFASPLLFCLRMHDPFGLPFDDQNSVRPCCF